MKNGILLILTSFILPISCSEQNGGKNENTIDTSTKMQSKNDSIIKPVSKSTKELFYYSGDSIEVTLAIDATIVNKLSFLVKKKDKKFQGTANLVLEEDNGKFYLPEGTPIKDEKTNEEYKCDSTFSYDSAKINFVFAIENHTKKRLSFIVNNSSIEGFGDNFYTLYGK